VLGPGSITIDDVTCGNGNGVIDVDECVFLMIPVGNTGLAPATGVTSTLAPVTLDVAVQHGSSPYPDIPVAGNGTNVLPFEVQTGTFFQAGTPIDLELAITSSSGSWTLPIVLPTGAPSGTGSSFTATGPVAIPDANPAGVALPFDVFVPSAIEKVVVQLRAPHTWVGDLTLTLVGPDGTTVILASANGGAGDNFGADCPASGNDTVFDDASATPLHAGFPPYLGTFRPIEPLSAFNGKRGAEVNGTWLLRAVDSFPGDTGTLDCATLVINGYAVTSGNCSDIIHKDSYEFGFYRWPVVQNDGDLAASAQSAMHGNWGMQTIVNDQNSLYTETRDVAGKGGAGAGTRHPYDENRTRVRFRFNPNDYDPGMALGRFRVRIMLALDMTPATRRQIVIVLRRNASGYALRARVANDSGVRTDTPFVPITVGPHEIEFDWVRSSGPGANDGTFQFTVDGTPAVPLAGLDTDEHGIDAMRIGAMSVKPGAGGTMFFDDFEARRQLPPSRPAALTKRR
jgi:subtilisin-like proprotein convertase family protein